MWNDFWKWSYALMDNQPFILVHNGDIIEHVHHRTTALSSHNIATQKRLAREFLKPHCDRAAKYFQIKGTEAHAGQSAEDEEELAESLGAVRDESTGQYSRWELWIKLAKELIHFSHHLATTSSTAYESSAPMRELVAAFVEAGQWNMRPPTMIVRSHRHRYIEVKPPNARIVVTPAWQAKTPFVFKIDRMRAPQFGGIIIREGAEGVHVRAKLYTIGPSEVIKA